MPIAVGNGSRVAQVSGNRRTKLEEPAPYALVGNIQTPLRKKILHIPIAQSEPGIEPNGASNDFRWKAVTFEGDGVHPKRLHRNHQIEIRELNVTMPFLVSKLPSCPLCGGVARRKGTPLEDDQHRSRKWEYRGRGGIESIDSLKSRLNDTVSVPYEGVY